MTYKHIRDAADASDDPVFIGIRPVLHEFVRKLKQRTAKEASPGMAQIAEQSGPLR